MITQWFAYGAFASLLYVDDDVPLHFLNSMFAEAVAHGKQPADEFTEGAREMDANMFDYVMGQLVADGFVEVRFA